MTKKERAPKKEKPTKRDKEILKQSSAERRESRKSKGVNAIITVVIVLVLLAVSTTVGLLVKDSPSDSSNAETNSEHNRAWVLNLLSNYDSTVSYLTEKGYTLDTDFVAVYDATRAEDNNGLVGSIKSSGDNGIFEIYYFERTENAAASKNAQTFYNSDMAPRFTADNSLCVRNNGRICFLGKGDVFQNLFWQYYLIEN